jgi:ribosomal-protein-serine acetyltransferase
MDILSSNLRLITDDVELRLLTLPDADTLFVLTDKNRLYLRSWLGWLDSTKSVDDTKKFIQNSLDQAMQDKAAHFGIYYQEKLVGVIGYVSIDKNNKKTTLGYWLDEKSQGKGVMTISVKLLIAYAFDVLKFNRIQITCAVGNNKSCAIPQRLGFSKEGVERKTEWLYDHYVDWEVYSLLRQEWKR